MSIALKLNKSHKISGTSFNFSSDKIKNVTVVKFLNKIRKNWPSISWKIKKNNKFYESSLLQLNNSKAKKALNWKAKLNINETINFVVEWYRNFKYNRKDIIFITSNQINKYMKKKS